MTTRDLYTIGARLLALYFVVTGLASLPVIYAAYQAAESANILNPILYSVSAAFYSTLSIVAGLVMLWLHGTPKNAAVDSPEPKTVLHVGLQLLGVYFSVSGFAGFVKSLCEILVISSSWPFRLTEAIPSLLLLVAGLILLFRTAIVARAAGVAS